MSLIEITPDDPKELLAPTEFPVIPPGTHVFVVANNLAITDTSPTDGSTPKQMISIEARCQDEDENKGMVVFDNILIISKSMIDNEPDPAKAEKLAKAKAIHDKKLTQFALACGVVTKEEVETSGLKIESLDDFNQRTFKAVTAVRMENVYPPEFDANGNALKRKRASIKRYLFEAEG